MQPPESKLVNTSPTPANSIPRTAISATAAIVIALLVFRSPLAPGQTPPPGNSRPADASVPAVVAHAPDEPIAIVAELNRLGDAQVSMHLTVPKEGDHSKDPAYVAPKYRAPDFDPDVNDMLERLEPSRVVRDVQYSFDPATRALEIKYGIAGFARNDEIGRWGTSLALVTEGLSASSPSKPPTVGGDAATFKGTIYTPWGLQPATRKVVIPAGSSKLAVADGRLTYAPPPTDEPKAGDADCTVKFEAVPQVMASLCKSYGYDKFPELWVARRAFKNTGGRKLTNYRVRFRIPGFADDDWSEWSSCPEVHPGQTVVDAYFPLFDIEKTAKIEGTRLNPVQMDCEYTVDGKVQEKKESVKVEILGRNEVILGKAVGNKFVNSVYQPFVLASFVTRDDPVIQRVAAMVSSQVPGGIQAALKLDRPLGDDRKPLKSFDRNQPAKDFMRQLYRFMIHNKFVYQTPPGTANVQHVKFARDVALNRAGTCIDLAIFYASVCEAVGLKPVLYLPPGHCFPGVFILPDKDDEFDSLDLVEVETTLLSPNDTFEAASAFGAKELLEPKPGEEVAGTANVPILRLLSVHSLELPPLPVDVLEKAGITPADPGDLVGVWSNTVNNVNFLTQFANDGTMFTIWTNAASNEVLFQGKGRYTYDGKHLTYSYPPNSQEAEVVWIDADHVNYRTLNSTIPGAKGAETVMTRRKKEAKAN